MKPFFFNHHFKTLALCLLGLSPLALTGCRYSDMAAGLGEWVALALQAKPSDPALLPQGSLLAAEADTGVLRHDAKSFGIYQWNKDQSYGDGLDQEISNLGTAPAYALYFVDKAMGFPKAIVLSNNDRKIRTIVTQELMEYSVGWDAGVLDSINSGKWDAYFRTFAREAKSVGEWVYYRFGYEMNGDWVSWGEKPAAFRLAWRRAWRIFKEEKATNIRWVFSPNVLWDDRTFSADILPYYPGDAFVDIVGLDGYNFGDRHSRHHRWRTYDEVFGESIAGMKKYFPEKPLWIAEIGCAEGENKSAWISQFLQKFNADPDIRVFIWFNEDKQYAGEPNWRIDSEPASLETFKDWAVHNRSITTYALPVGDSAYSYRPVSELRATRRL